MNVLRQHMRRAFTRVHPFTAVTKANRGLSTASRLSKAYLNTLLHRRQGLCGRWVAAQLFTKEESGRTTGQNLHVHWERRFADAAETTTAPAFPASATKVGENTEESKGTEEPRKRVAKLQPRLIEEDEHGILSSDIPITTLKVMLTLRGAGHEGYIVGGAVRDLILRTKPKDFDILTSATPRQVKRLFPFALLIGRRHPIVKFTSSGLEMEISSFTTGTQSTDLPDDAAALLAKKSGNSRGEKRRRRSDLHEEDNSLTLEDLEDDGEGLKLSWCGARMRNALDRDFTVNSMMYDPFSRVVFDYTNGLQHCRQRRLSFILDPKTSLTIDPARGLRAVRLAARVGLEFEPGSLRAIRDHRELLLSLGPGRLQMELESIMSCGAAAKSVKLLWILNLLEYIFPPIQEALQHVKYPKTHGRVSPSKNSLFRVLESMDAAAGPENPLPAFVWPAVLVGFASQIRGADAVVRKPRKGKAANKKDACGNSSDSQTDAAESLSKSRSLWRSTLGDFMNAEMNPIPKTHMGFILTLLEGASGTEKERKPKVVKYKCHSCGNLLRFPPSKSPYQCTCGKPVPRQLRQLKKSTNELGRQIVREALQQC